MKEPSDIRVDLGLFKELVRSAVYETAKELGPDAVVALFSGYKKIPEDLVNDLVNVQPMPSNLIKDLIESGRDESELIAKGYQPVCPTTKLLWVKS